MDYFVEYLLDLYQSLVYKEVNGKKNLNILKPSYVINMYFKVQAILNGELSKSRSYHGKFICAQLSSGDSHRV